MQKGRDKRRRNERELRIKLGSVGVYVSEKKHQP